MIESKVGLTAKNQTQTRCEEVLHASQACILRVKYNPHLFKAPRANCTGPHEVESEGIYCIYQIYLEISGGVLVIGKINSVLICNHQCHNKPHTPIASS